MKHTATAVAPRGRPRREAQQSQLDAACAAVAHRGRRAILDLLARAGELSAGEIAAAFPSASRQSVSAQLRTLRRAQLVESVRRYREPAALADPQLSAADGRELRYRLSPQPLEQVQQWVEGYRGFWTTKLEELAVLAGQNPAALAEPNPTALRPPHPVTLGAGRVTLVPLSEAYWPQVRAALKHRELWALSATPMRTAADARAYLDTALAEQADGRGVPFAILVAGARGSRQFAGSTRLMNIAREHRRLEIGWSWLLPHFQRTGVNRQAKLLLLTHCFEELGCERVEFKGHAHNAKSRAALEGIGATFEGILRHHMLMPDGSWRDSFYCSILAPEWPQVKLRLTAAIRT